MPAIAAAAALWIVTVTTGIPVSAPSSRAITISGSTFPPWELERSSLRKPQARMDRTTQAITACIARKSRLIVPPKGRW